jgi:hypothetical protein
MLTMDPPPDWRIAGTTALQQFQMPTRGTGDQNDFSCQAHETSFPRDLPIDAIPG